MKNVFVNIDYLRNKNRKEFYSDKKTLLDLNKDVLKICLQNNVPVPNTIVEKFNLCKKDDPEYKIWTAFSIISYSDVKERITFFSHSISTDGEIFSHAVNKLVGLNPDKETTYYRVGVGLKLILVHRAVLSSFGYDQAHDSELPLNKLTVNHINRNRSINKLSNLEWMTLDENIADMQSGLSKDHPKYPHPLKITLHKNINGLNKGSVFFLRKRKDLSLYGLNDGSVRNAITKGFHLYGCYFETLNIEQEGIPNYGIPNELKVYFNSKGSK